MITLKHIEIYKKYQGDGDGFVRSATQEEKSNMNYNVWSLLDGFVQDLTMIKNNLTSPAFIKSTIKKIEQNCENEEVVKSLMALL